MYISSILFKKKKPNKCRTRVMYYTRDLTGRNEHYFFIGKYVKSRVITLRIIISGVIT